MSEVCREHSISESTYFNWKAKYGGMTAAGDDPVLCGAHDVAAYDRVSDYDLLLTEFTSALDQVIQTRFIRISWFSGVDD